RWLRMVEFTQECWLWTGARQAGGYGRFAGDDGLVLVHRWAYERFRGPIAEHMTVDHLCLTTRCVNPSHMEIVTRQENARRANPNVDKSICVNGHEYTPENTYTNPRGYRDCRICRSERSAERYRKKRAASASTG
ncbi:MAG: HNH endonuclease signature motif containing protein, partial [Nocardioidaceae bacterium]